MKNYILAIAIISALSSCSVAKVEFLSDDFINEINSKQSTWIAGRNFHPDTPIEELRRRNGALLDPNRDNIQRKLYNVDVEAIPDTFDGRTYWPQCESLRAIRDQGGCGSCWAFSSVEAMTDKLCIATNGTVKFEFSPEDLMTCCPTCGSCDGGVFQRAYQYWVDEGIVSGGDYNTDEGCQPYAEDPYKNGKTPQCSTSCLNSNYPVAYSNDKHFGESVYYTGQAVEQIQTEILNHGPVTTYIDVYEDFYSYKSGVYVYTSGESVGGHGVKILGWGTENGTPYWLVANSWGSDWADLGGFFKFLRGDNHCRIEEWPFGGIPKV